MVRYAPEDDPRPRQISTPVDRTRTTPLPTLGDVLDYERTRPAGREAHVDHIREVFHLHQARYLQLLHRYIDSPEALEYDPVTTHRLRRIRDEATTQRAARRLPERHHPK